VVHQRLRVRGGPHTRETRKGGLRHEAAYLLHLNEHTRLFVTHLAEIESEQRVLDETLRFMGAGAELIAQGALADRD
jgi:hypothetical protein